MKTHFRNRRKPFKVSACGKTPYLYPDLVLTTDLDAVNCARCMGSKVFRDCDAISLRQLRQKVLVEEMAPPRATNEEPTEKRD